MIAIVSTLVFTFFLWVAAILTWQDTISNSVNESNNEGMKLRSAEGIHKNKNGPTTVKFIEKEEDADKNNNHDHSDTISCFYKSFNQLTEQEIQPKSGIDHRHIKTPPIGGKLTLVCCDTTVGPLSIVVHANWAPIGAQRFLDMVSSGYMNYGVPLFRCMKGFLCQFGLSSDSEHAQDFRSSIEDDPQWLPAGPTNRHNAAGVARFAQGYLAYAGGGKNSRSKQLIVALKDNGPLGGGSPWEVPWGELVGSDSFQTLSKIYTGYGDKGPSQGRLNKEGLSEELRQAFPKLDYINSCQIIDERIQEEPF